MADSQYVSRVKHRGVAKPAMESDVRRDSGTPGSWVDLAEQEATDERQRKEARGGAAEGHTRAGCRLWAAVTTRRTQLPEIIDTDTPGTWGDLAEREATGIQQSKEARGGAAKGRTRAGCRPRTQRGAPGHPRLEIPAPQGPGGTPQNEKQWAHSREERSAK
ncbi:hypothetical protein NDU88_003097 [Pleurodeles waltl]|uniref:Uncharacterized protein n=1 Tax=Pleurodeles waltl TaxID=8319 RepID=A0AAV7PFZ6_PLEWA|nr:hypothetical protein NDU88_003097 [Pleurodeles waltl]